MLILILVTSFLVNVQGHEMGPYVAKVTNITKCEFRGKELTAQFPWHTEAYEKSGRSLLRFNASILNNLMGGVYMHGILSAIQSDKQNKTVTKIFEVQGSACTHYIFKIFMSIMGAKLSPRDCRFKKGFYTGEGIDVDEVTHLLTKVLPYGSFLSQVWATAATMSKGVIFCMRMFIETTPAVKSLSDN